MPRQISKLFFYLFCCTVVPSWSTRICSNLSAGVSPKESKVGCHGLEGSIANGAAAVLCHPSTDPQPAPILFVVVVVVFVFWNWSASPLGPSAQPTYQHRQWLSIPVTYTCGHQPFRGNPLQHIITAAAAGVFCWNNVNSITGISERIGLEGFTVTFED